jgi:enoyl-CoA hydratase
VTSFKNILVEIRENIGLITFNRPEALNALCEELMIELASALDNLEKNDLVNCIILTGSEKAFAAGADVKEMQSKTLMNVYKNDFITNSWERLTTCRKPVIAAVAGYALGGGCEVAMMCDFIIAADTAKFGQPEVAIGTLPGAGGTQRLTRAIGKAKAMEMCLTGRIMDAKEAEQLGLVARIVPADKLLDEAIESASKIASMSKPSILMIKEAVNCAFEMNLSQGINYERRLFHASFGTNDQKEGMAAFIEKRNPQWTHD